MSGSLVDFHCHLDLYPDFADLIQTCEHKKIYALTVTTTPRAWPRNAELTKSTKFVRAALGLHPQLIQKHHGEVELFCELLPDAAYVGEIGLDGSREYASSIPLQTKTLERILDACMKNGGRIMSMHSRGAVPQLLDVLGNYRSAGTPILHWFSGTQKQLERAIAMGCWFSVGPQMLAGAKGKDLALQMPRERVLTETDGPFGMNGSQPLYPWDAKTAILKLGEIWGVEPLNAQKQIVKNLGQLIRL